MNAGASQVLIKSLSLIFLVSFLFLTGCASLGPRGVSTANTNVICAVTPSSVTSYPTKAIRSSMATYNSDLGVARIAFNDRSKYEICYNKVSKKLVRRNPNNLATFVTFDTSTLDTDPYIQDYIIATPAQIQARVNENCASEEAADKAKWRLNSESVYHTATFVMDDSGRIYASTVFKKCVFHHSSYLAEGPVAAAGEMRVDNGVLQSINNESGHYRPPAWTLRSLLDQLTARGLDITNVACDSNPNSRADSPGPPSNCP